MQITSVKYFSAAQIPVGKPVRFGNASPASSDNRAKNLRYWSKPTMLAWNFIQVMTPSGSKIDQEKMNEIGRLLGEAEKQHRAGNLEVSQRGVKNALDEMNAVMAPFPQEYRDMATEPVKQLLAYLSFRTGQENLAERLTRELMSDPELHIMDRWKYTNNLASTMKQQGRLQEAQALLEQGLANNPYPRPPKAPDGIDGFDSRVLQEISYYENFANWGLGDMMLNLADTYRQRGENARAEQTCEMLLENIPDFPIKSGNASGYMSDKRERLEKLAEIYTDLGKEDRAAELLAQSAAIRQRVGY